MELVLIPPEFLDGENAGERAKLIGRHRGLVYQVDDCRTTYEDLLENGVDFRSEPEEMRGESKPFSPIRTETRS